MLIKQCVCGSRSFDITEIHELSMNICRKCAALHQIVDLQSEDELFKWYQEKYHSSIYTHSFAHDKKVASQRLKAYQLKGDLKILDIGAGNGAFVVQASLYGHNVTGVEPSDTNLCNDIHHEKFRDIHFPTDEFDVVTLHDVVEHFVDPVIELKEVHRTLKPEGEVIIDFPDFFDDAGSHHWKSVEHLWMLDQDQLIQMLCRIGFYNFRVDHPIPGKLVVRAKKRTVKRPSILVPPGIGDIYWVLVKLQSFMKDHKISMCDLYISSPDSSKDRSVDYTRMVPFVNAAGYRSHTHRGCKIWNEAYMRDGRTVFGNVVDCDYFIAYNGVTRFGKSLSEVDPQWKCDWYFPLYQSLNQKAWIKRYKQEIGEYIIGYIVPHGMYKHWLCHYNINKIRDMYRELAKVTGKKIVLIGASWDKNTLESQLGANEPHVVDLTGQTTLEQCFALLRGASAIVGFPSGITIVPTSFKIPTTLIWNQYFDRRFWINTCPPDSFGRWYQPLDSARLENETVIDTTVQLMENMK